jgi:orotate phosphoribosyltransferase
MRIELKELLKTKSIKTGHFVLASGKESDLYVDCRVTTLDARGAVMIGEVLFQILSEYCQNNKIRPKALGGLTMGADPIALSVAIRSSLIGNGEVIQAFTVRKEAKGHGRGKKIEGNFNSGDEVIVVDDVITTGESTLKAIQAIEEEGGKVLAALVLVDREEGGRQKIESQGYPVIAAYTRTELLS